jgi:pyruvate dehydrogenase E2 component (dihydrolipoamide acetyltransferase)
MSKFLMPSLGADMEAGTLVEQLVQPGEPVKRGDVIAAVETQKGTIEIEVFEDGTLQEWLVDLGTKVDVGAPLAMILAEGEAPTEPVPEPTPNPTPAPKPEHVAQEPEPKPIEPTPPQPQQQRSNPKPDSRPRITPAARRRAAQQGIDLSSIASKGTITLADLESPTPQAAATPKPAPVSAMRSAIASAMSRSNREIPHYYLSHAVDLTAADDFVTRFNADRAPQDRLLLGAVYARALAKALSKYTEFNGHYIDDAFHQSGAVHLGFAVNIRGGGLIAPALFDAEAKPIEDLMTDLRDLVERARTGRLRARELSEATITLTSLGDRGVDQLYGVIYPPQVAIVGLGTPRLQPAVHDGEVAPRLTSSLTLSADHRVSDGHRGALFLKAIDKNLQRPEQL